MSLNTTRHPSPSERTAILVIDDEPLVLMAARRALERTGYDVLTAVGGQEGIRQFLAHRDRIAAVLLDISMPEFSGTATFAELQRHGLNVPVVLTSGYGEHVAESEFPRDLVAGFVPKPYRARELVHCLQEALS